MSDVLTTNGDASSVFGDDLFEVLDTEVPADELEVRAHESGFAYVQAPNGNTAEVLAADGGVMVQEVEADDVDFENREEISDVFGSSIVAE